MKQFWLVLAALIFSANASAQDLPPEVAQAYRDYQSAYAAGDVPALLEAAARAYTTGDDADIDAATLATLAENYGFAANASGEFETAQDMWRQSARMSDRARLAPADRAWRWHNAALSALRLQDVDDAYACSRQAVEALGDLDDQAGVSDFAADSYLTHAGMSLRRGRLGVSKRSAERAVELMEMAGPELTVGYGLALFYLGVAQTLDLEFEDAAYSLHLAQDILREQNPDHPDHPDSRALRAAYASAWMEVRRGDEVEVAARTQRIEARLDVHSLHEEYFAAIHAEGSNDEAVTPPRPAGWTDAEIVRRREPQYPMDALNVGVGGVVYVEFEITPSGETDNIRVVAAFPYGVFDEEVIDAVETWRYEPARQDGVAVRRTGMETRFQFQIAGDGHPVDNMVSPSRGY